jgi:hypothetical protein
MIFSLLLQTRRTSGDPVTTTLPQTARPGTSNADNLISSPTPPPVFSLLAAIFLYLALVAFFQSPNRCQFINMQ